MGSSKEVTVGYDYRFDIHMGLCRGPIDEIVQINAGGRQIWPNPNSTIIPDPILGNQLVAINAANAFGGESGEGGVNGWLVVLMGGEDQEVSPYFHEPVQYNPAFGEYVFAPMHGELTPAFRGVATALFSGLIGSINPYPKAWAYRTRRALNGWDGETWYPEKAVVWLAGDTIRAMNPAHMTYEALTNRDWGRGFPRSLLGSTWTGVADTLYSEGFGMCIRWTRQGSVNEFIQQIMDHIGGNTYLDPRTGLWEVSLNRDNYNPADLPIFDPDTGLLGIDEDESGASVFGANEIIVIYRDPITNEDQEVRCQSLAAVQAAGGIFTQKLSYPGIPTQSLAARIGQRELSLRSVGVKRFKVRLDRRAYKLLPGSVFRLSEPLKGISEIVVRVAKIDYGTLASGEITVEVIQDIFSLPSASYVGIQPPEWIPPSTIALPPTAYAVFEVSYRDLSASLPSADLDAISFEAGLVSAVVARPSNLSINYFLDTRVAPADFVERETGDFCPTATLVEEMPRTEVPVTVAIENGRDGNLIEVGMEAFVDDEVMRVDAINDVDGTVTLARGCVDTVPEIHSAGTRIWFYDSGFISTDTTEYVSGITVDTRFRTRTSAAVLDAVDAPEVSLVLSQRQYRPYPPGKLRFNDAAYPPRINGSLNLSWCYRNRLTQADQLIDTSVGNVSPESGTASVLQVFDENDVKRLDATEFGTGFSIDDATEYSWGAVDSAPNRDLRIVGLGVLSSDLADVLDGEVYSRVDEGWLKISAFGGGSFVDEATALVTDRDWSVAWETATETVGFNLNPSVYQSNISYDPAVGLAVAVSKPSPDGHAVSDLAASDLSLQLVRDRRLDARRVIAMTTKQFVLAYWATNYQETRVIIRNEFILHTVAKSAISSGPLVSARTVVSGWNRANMGQFNSPDGWYGAQVPGTVGRISSGYLSDIGRFARLSVAFGNLLYVVYLDTNTSQSTVGKPFDITGVLDSHLDISTTVTDRTAVYAIDLDGAVSLIATRSGCVLADQVSATQGVEILNGSIYAVNSTTGVLGSLIATLPGAVKATRVAGDTASETFYVLADNGSIYQYDLAGTLLGSLLISVGANTTLVGNNSLVVTQNYVYFGFGGFVGGAPHGQVFRIEKDLSSFSVFLLSTVVGGSGSSVDWVVAHPESDLIHAIKLIDESADSSSLVLNDVPRLNDELRVVLGCQRGVITSFQSHDVTMIRAGYGLRYGEFYGG